MEVKNDLGQIVSVTLNNIDMTSSIPNKFFVIKDITKHVSPDTASIFKELYD
jgi:hypothetical protein